MDYQGVCVVSHDETSIILSLTSHNIMRLTVSFEAKTGYKGGDRISVELADAGGTSWDVETTKTQWGDPAVGIYFDGWSESEMCEQVLLLAYGIISGRRKGNKMKHIAAEINRKINESLGITATSQLAQAACNNPEIAKPDDLFF